MPCLVIVTTSLTPIALESGAKSASTRLGPVRYRRTRAGVRATTNWWFVGSRLRFSSARWWRPTPPQLRTVRARREGARPYRQVRPIGTVPGDMRQPPSGPAGGWSHGSAHRNRARPVARGAANEYSRGRSLAPRNAASLCGQCGSCHFLDPRPLWQTIPSTQPPMAFKPLIPVAMSLRIRSGPSCSSTASPSEGAYSQLRLPEVPFPSTASWREAIARNANFPRSPPTIRRGACYDSRLTVASGLTPREAEPWREQHCVRLWQHFW